MKQHKIKYWASLFLVISLVIVALLNGCSHPATAAEVEAQQREQIADMEASEVANAYEHMSVAEKMAGIVYE